MTPFDPLEEVAEAAAGAAMEAVSRNRHWIPLTVVVVGLVAVVLWVALS
jgi:hypothetical protein